MGTDDEDVSNPPSGWDMRRERVMAELEHVALELFAQHGYDAVSYEDIARSAGVSWRTVYRYFPTKEAFLLATTRRALSLGVAAVENLASTGKPFDDYFDAIVALTDQHAEGLEDVILWSRAMRTVPPEVAQRAWAERTAMLGQAVLGLCSEGLGVPSDDVRAVAAAAAIAAVNRAVVEHWAATDGREDLGTLFVEAVDGLRQSLRTRPQPARLTRSSAVAPRAR